jgi:hypothetical protein
VLCVMCSLSCGDMTTADCAATVPQRLRSATNVLSPNNDEKPALSQNTFHSHCLSQCGPVQKDSLEASQFAIALPCVFVFCGLLW